MDPRLALSLASSAAGLFALCRLVYTGAHRSYPWFALYLAAASLQSFVWLAGGPSDHLYLLVWASSTAVLLGLRVVIVVELWRKLMINFRGVETLSRSFVGIILLFALAVSAASGLDGLPLFGAASRQFAYSCLSLALRYSGSALCVVCSGLSLFAVMFPKGLPRNLVRHAFLLTAYFASIATGFLAMHFSLGSAPLVGALLTGSSAGFYVLWGLLLSEPGERSTVRLPALSQPELT